MSDIYKIVDKLQKHKNRNMGKKREQISAFTLSTIEIGFEYISRSIKAKRRVLRFEKL